MNKQRAIRLLSGVSHLCKWIDFRGAGTLLASKRSVMKMQKWDTPLQSALSFLSTRINLADWFQPIRSGRCFSLLMSTTMLMAIGLSLTACQLNASTTPPSPENRFEAVTIRPEQVVTGQTVYVPVYSYVYQRSTRNPVMQVSATLSIRNTDLAHSIILQSVRYYSNDGKLLRNYLETPIEISRLASADYLVEAEDLSGGLGANFIVEWVADTEVSEPVIEALMISTTSSQGISFISPGRVIRQWEGQEQGQLTTPATSDSLLNQTE